MNITQKQIEAALNYANKEASIGQWKIVADYDPDDYPNTNCMAILAAAYREKCEECERLEKELESAISCVPPPWSNQ